MFAGSSGIALGALLASRPFFGRNLLDAVTAAPLVMPPTVLGYYVLVFFGRSSVLGHAIERVTGQPIVFTKSGAVLAATIGSFPLVVQASRAAIESVDRSIIHAARTLGATPLRALFTVTLPLASRGIVAGLVLGYARALGDFGITLMVAGNIPGETQTASLAIYDALQSQDEGRAKGMIAVLTAIAIASIYLVNRLTKARRHE